MKFFLDSALVEEAEMAASMGLLDGITTNPSLVAKSGRSYRAVISDLCAICPGPISAEVLEMGFSEMLDEAKSWHSFSPQIVVKIPMTEVGMRVVASCQELGISTNVTLCFSATQALLAAKAGATYISPFVGRLDDLGLTGMDLIQEIRQIYERFDFKTKILVASIRSPLHLKEAACIGADVATLPLKVMRQLACHPLTDKGLESFLVDSKKIPKL